MLEKYQGHHLFFVFSEYSSSCFLWDHLWKTLRGSLTLNIGSRTIKGPFGKVGRQETKIGTINLTLAGCLREVVVLTQRHFVKDR